MHIRVYEDQTGLKIYEDGSAKQEKDQESEKFEIFFRKSMELYIQRKNGKLSICSHILAYKSGGRTQGYYVAYTDDYNEGYFSSFKKNMVGVLQSLELNVVEDRQNTYNIIFNNVEMFDNRGLQYNKIGTIIAVLKKGNKLEYKGGDIVSISAFCGKILENAGDINIAISSRDVISGDGDIDILINRRFDALSETVNTGRILRDYELSIEREEKEKRGKFGKEEILRGFSIVEQGANSLFDVGYTVTEIKSEIDKGGYDTLYNISKRVSSKTTVDDVGTGKRGIDDVGTGKRGIDDVGTGKRGIDDVIVEEKKKSAENVSKNPPRDIVNRKDANNENGDEEERGILHSIAHYTWRIFFSKKKSHRDTQKDVKMQHGEIVEKSYDNYMPKPEKGDLNRAGYIIIAAILLLTPVLLITLFAPQYVPDELYKILRVQEDVPIQTVTPTVVKTPVAEATPIMNNTTSEKIAKNETNVTDKKITDTTNETISNATNDTKSNVDNVTDDNSPLVEIRNGTVSNV